MKNKKSFFHRVNWIDGMKINKTSFIDLENSMLQSIAESNSHSLNPNNFGLLPDYTGTNNGVDISISMDGQETLVVVVNKCNAVTLGGHRIIINEEVTGYLEQSGHVLQKQYKFDIKEAAATYIIISVNPYSRIPIGEADPEEDPVRHPFVLCEYKIDVLKEEEVNSQAIGLNHLTVGKVIMIDGKPHLDEGYIPACNSIQSHPDLMYTYTEVGAFLNALELYNTHIVQKILQKKQTNDLARMVFTLSNEVLAYLKYQIPVYRTKVKYAPPVEMIMTLDSLARTIKGSLDIYVGTGKEELLNYLTDWCDLNQGAFENVLQEMIDLEYIHTDINKCLEKAANFTMLMNSLFKKLNELDYIGKKSDSNIFVKEDVIAEEDVKKRRRFFME